LLKFLKPVLAWGSLFLLINLIIFLFYPELEQWIYYLFYMLASTSFIAIPHEPIVLFYGKIYGIWLPFIFAIIPTILGCYIDYLVLTPVLNHQIFNKIKESKFYIKTVGYFNNLPFTTILLIAMTPVPFYPVRILSIASGYSAVKYSMAVLLGRFPRYLLLAAGGKILNIKDEYLILILLLLLLWYSISFINKIYFNYVENKSIKSIVKN